MTNSCIGIRIKDARERARLRQEDLAATLGVSFNTIRNYEKSRTMPPVGKLSEIADVLDVDLLWLIDGEATA
jgi:transcriptional regulator with XRE-family HTH domain